MRKIRCSNCLSLKTKRFGTYIVGAKKKRYRKQRFLCLSCNKSFTVKQTKNISRVIQAHLLRDSLEGRSSIRTIARRKHLSKTTVGETILEIAKQTKGSVWIAKHFKPKWGHVLSVDGKIIRVFNPGAKDYKGTGPEKAAQLKKTWIAGVDVLTKDLPHYCVADGEGKIDMYEYFKTLKNNIGYDLKVLVSDGKPDTKTAVRIVYGADVGIQLCIRHFVETLKTILREERKQEQAATENLVINIWSALNLRYETDCMDVLKVLTGHPETRCQKLIVHTLTRHIFELTTHFRFQDQYFVPRYNNDVENLFKQVSLRLKSWNMFRSKQNAEHYLKAWALYRRFTKFTDCRGHINRLKNGKAPLELAGVDLTDIDYLNLK